MGKNKQQQAERGLVNSACKLNILIWSQPRALSLTCAMAQPHFWLCIRNPPFCAPGHPGLLRGQRGIRLPSTAALGADTIHNVFFIMWKTGWMQLYWLWRQLRVRVNCIWPFALTPPCTMHFNTVRYPMRSPLTSSASTSTHAISVTAKHSFFCTTCMQNISEILFPCFQTVTSYLPTLHGWQHLFVAGIMWTHCCLCKGSWMIHVYNPWILDSLK